jgi:hypothetical protein
MLKIYGVIVGSLKILSTILQLCVGFKLTSLVVIDTNCIASYKSNYHKITTTPR